MPPDAERPRDAAAHVGRYSAVLQLGYSSKQVKTPGNTDLDEDLLQVPGGIYRALHSLQAGP